MKGADGRDREGIHGSKKLRLGADNFLEVLEQYALDKRKGGISNGMFGGIEGGKFTDGRVVPKGKIQLHALGRGKVGIGVRHGFFGFGECVHKGSLSPGHRVENTFY